jgi:hypothetical protein
MTDAEKVRVAQKLCDKLVNAEKARLAQKVLDSITLEEIHARADAEGSYAFVYDPKYHYPFSYA